MYILTLGDVMLDRNYFGTTTRGAPEAVHVPIYQINRTDALLGGAANVAKNLGNLPGVTVELLTVLGTDAAADEVTRLLPRSVRANFLRETNRQTTVKHRIFDAETGKLVNRYDCESVADISVESENELVERVEQVIRSTNVDAIVLIDYSKGVVTARVAAAVIALANTQGIPTFVDPKIKEMLKYRDCFCFKPNLHEGQVLTGKETPVDVLRALRTRLNPRCIVLTCGAEGLYLTEGDGKPPLHLTHPAPVPVVDVTGAGDTAMSTLVYLYCRGQGMPSVCRTANRICGQSIQCIGNYTLSAADFYPDDPDMADGKKIEALNRVEAAALKKTIFSRKTIFSSPPGRIVFTNGCFDLIHAAHLQLLTFAKQQGDVLIVGVNSDASVRRLKGPTRPVNPESERVALLESLPFVDYVVVFDEDTPAALIKALRPHVLVKGGDYIHDNIVGRDDVEEVIRFEYQTGRSSTAMINRIIKPHS